MPLYATLPIENRLSKQKRGLLNKRLQALAWIQISEVGCSRDSKLWLWAVVVPEILILHYTYMLHAVTEEAE